MTRRGPRPAYWGSGRARMRVGAPHKSWERWAGRSTASAVTSPTYNITFCPSPKGSRTPESRFRSGARHLRSLGSEWTKRVMCPFRRGPSRAEAEGAGGEAGSGDRQVRDYSGAGALHVTRIPRRADCAGVTYFSSGPESQARAERAPVKKPWNIHQYVQGHLASRRCIDGRS